MKHIPAILLLLSLAANFIDLSYCYAGNSAGYSLLVCIALLSNPLYGFPQKMYIYGLMSMNIVGLVCCFYKVDYPSIYDLVVGSVIVTISIIRFKFYINGSLGNNR